MPQLTYETPSEIDGEPEDVAELAIAQLQDILVAVGDLIELTAAQVRNAHGTKVLRIDPAAPAERLAELWASSDAAGQLARVKGAANTAERIAVDLSI